MIMGAYDLRMSRISVVGVPSSAGSYAAGQDQAPGALRSAGLVEAFVAAGIIYPGPGARAQPEGQHPVSAAPGLPFRLAIALRRSARLI
jgi:arginase family enzyme